MIKNQRRVFRGRGGPTDGRLPKDNARRRRHPHPKPTVVEVCTVEDSFRTSPALPNPGSFEILVAQGREVNEMEPNCSNLERSDLVDPCCDKLVNQANQVSPSCKPPSVDPQVEAYQSEVDHLVQRIKNNQKTMQLSTAITNPLNYQKHVLDAVHNTVCEWKAIFRRYYSDASSEDDSTKADRTRVGTLVFHLLQQALQCGPLAGSKPGYMKRCGSSVAKQVLEFLEKSFPSRQESDGMGLTEKQLHAIDKWKKDAQAASCK